MEIRNFLVLYKINGRDCWKPVQTVAPGIVPDNDIPGAVQSSLPAGARITAVVEVFGKYSMQDLQAMGAAGSMEEIRRKYGAVKVQAFRPPFWKRKGALFR